MPDDLETPPAPPAIESADVVDVDAVKQQRRSLTRGPVAVTLLFLFGVAGLVGIGGFWSYPVWQETEQTRDEIENARMREADLRKQLADVKRKNEEAEPSPVERVLARRIPPTYDAPQLVRDIVTLVALDPTRPDDNLSLKSFAIATPKTTGDISSVAVTLSLTGSSDGIQSLLESVNCIQSAEGAPARSCVDYARDASDARRIAVPRSLSLNYGGASVGGAADEQSSLATLRLSYLLRQERRHLLTDAERIELEDAKLVREERYQTELARRDEILAELRAVESENYTGGVELLTRADRLTKLRAELKEQNALLKQMERDAKAAAGEVTASVVLEFYFEQPPTGANAKGKAGATPTKT